MSSHVFSTIPNKDQIPLDAKRSFSKTKTFLRRPEERMRFLYFLGATRPLTRMFNHRSFFQTQKYFPINFRRFASDLKGLSSAGNKWELQKFVIPHKGLRCTKTAPKHIQTLVDEWLGDRTSRKPMEICANFFATR